MNELLIYSLVMLGSVFISSVSQVGLKKAAQKEHASFLKEYLNPLVIVSYGLFFLSTFLTMFAMKVVPLSMAPILESVGYVFVSVLGYLFLKERFSARKTVGLICIIVGIVIFSL